MRSPRDFESAPVAPLRDGASVKTHGGNRGPHTALNGTRYSLIQGSYVNLRRVYVRLLLTLLNVEEKRRQIEAWWRTKGSNTCGKAKQ
jgi:hypothetical protein